LISLLRSLQEVQEFLRAQSQVEDSQLLSERQLAVYLRASEAYFLLGLFLLLLFGTCICIDQILSLICTVLFVYIRLVILHESNSADVELIYRLSQRLSSCHGHEN
jgi:hypothetical protein